LSRNVIRVCAAAAVVVALATGSVLAASASTTSGPGAQLWIKRYNGPGNGVDQANAVAVSPSGKTVYVTGTSYASSASGIGDYATVGYSAATGARLWVKRYNGPGNMGGVAEAVSVSPTGKTVFVTGYTYGSPATGTDIATIAYNAATGAQLWVKRYGGSGDGDDKGLSMAVSPSGKTVFVTGQTFVAGFGSPLYATVAYNAANGAQLWAKIYRGAGNLHGFTVEAAASVAVSPTGKTVYVTGQGATSGNPDYATVAYNAANGAQLWVKLYRFPASSICQATAVTVSPAGKAVYVTGYYEAAASAGYATVAYNAVTGAPLWVKRYSPKGGSDAAYSVAVSPSGKTVFVTGGVYGGGGEGDEDYATVAYNAATGGQLWAKRYNPTGGTNYAHAVAVSPSGKTVYVTGASGFGYATLGYNATTGAQQWVRRYDGLFIPSLPGAALSMAVSRVTGAVFVTGYIVSAALSVYDYTTIAYRG
jgi:hypothetical protein